MFEELTGSTQLSNWQLDSMAAINHTIFFLHDAPNAKMTNKTNSIPLLPTCQYERLRGNIDIPTTLIEMSGGFHYLVFA